MCHASRGGRVAVAERGDSGGQLGAYPGGCAGVGEQHRPERDRVCSGGNELECVRAARDPAHRDDREVDGAVNGQGEIMYPASLSGDRSLLQWATRCDLMMAPSVMIHEC